jgi:hypothetical protein
MSRTSPRSKVDSCVQLLLGLRHREVREVLQKYKCTPETLRHGWELVSRVGLSRAEQEGNLSAPDNTRALLSELANHLGLWFPIVRATLRGQAPELVTPFFSGLAQGSAGSAAIVGRVFLGRLRDLARGEEPFGPKGSAARAVLERRGLTAQVEEEIACVLEAWEKPVAGDGRNESAGEQAEEEALAAMWGFYLEWRGIASRALTNPSHLRWLGLCDGPSSRGKKPGRVKVEIRAQRPSGSTEPTPEPQQVLRLESKQKEK